MNYQTVGTELQTLRAAVVSVTTSNIEIPTLARTTLNRRVDGQSHTVRTAEHGAMQMIFDETSSLVIVFYAGEIVLHIDRDGRLRSFVSGAWELDLVYLAQWIHDANRAARQPNRCGHYAAIQRFFGFAQSRELNTRADNEIRWAISAYFDLAIMSRSQLTGAQWWEAGNAVRDRQLAW